MKGWFLMDMESKPLLVGGLMESYKVIYLGYIEHGMGQHQSNTVTSVNGVSPALTTLQGGTQQIKILVGRDGYKN